MNYKRIMALTATTCFLLLAVAITASAQEPNVSLSDQMDYLIAPLDFSEVTSGLLLDRGFRMMNVEDFDAQMNIEQFSPKENGDSPLGTFQGTFQFTVTIRNRNRFHTHFRRPLSFRRPSNLLESSCP